MRETGIGAGTRPILKHNALRPLGPAPAGVTPGAHRETPAPLSRQYGYSRLRPGHARPAPSEMTTSASTSFRTDAAPDGVDLRALLVRFTVALNRRRAYAAAHPMVAQAEQALYESFQGVLRARASITLGVAHRELLIDQASVEQAGATARELAERLHRRGVGAITISAGLSLDGLQRALTWLAHDPNATASRVAVGTDVTAAPPAARGADEPPVTTGFAIAKVAYERLALTDEDSDAQREIAALWRSLAAVAFDADIIAATSDGSDLENASPEALADAIRERIADRAFAGRVGSVVQSIASQLRTAAPGVRQEVASRLRAVVTQLGQSDLGAIIRATGGGPAQRQFITALLDVMPASAIVEWLELAANATDQQLSHHLLRILTKLSGHAGERRQATAAPEAFREASQALVAGWELDDPNPIEHGALLDFIAATTRTATPLAGGRAGLPEDLDEGERAAPDEHAIRLVQMACEIDVAGPDATAAAQSLVIAGHTALLFECLIAAPGQAAAQQLRHAVTTPEALLQTLLREPFDVSSARTLLGDLDIGAAPVLLDALERARPRSARRLLLSTLTQLGPSLAPLLLERLDASPPWYFVRNLLLLLRDTCADEATAVGQNGAHRSLLTFLDHSQEQVRMEALRLLMERPAERDAAIRRALDDRSARVVALAIDALASATASTGSGAGLGREVANRLMRFADAKDGEADLRARAIRTLVLTSNPIVRDWLLAHVARSSRFLRRLTLADAQPTVLASLHVLAVRYATDPRVAPVLALACARPARDPRRLAVERAMPGDPA